MAQYQWYGTASSCPSAVNPQVGWYSGSTFITSSYKNPSTGEPYTPAELGGLSGGGGGTTGGAASGTIIPTNTWNPFHAGWNATPEEQAAAHQAYINGGWSGATPATPGFKMPSWAEIAGQVPAAPPYTPSPETLAWQEKIGANLGNILEQEGIGIPEKTQEQLYLREAETINASTTQAMKNLEDEMAARGMSNSGLLFSEKMKLQAKGDIARANVMRDVKIQDAMMKLASYENALGLSVQFVSYLSEESWRAYQPKLATWEAKVNFYRDAIQDAYYKQNLAQQHQYTMELAQFEADTNLQIAEMELEATNKAAKAQGIGYVIGAVLGGIFGS